jgi:hypothetical protein
MPEKHKTANKKQKAPGPIPEKLRIKSDWQRAIKKSLKKKKPAKGWPK